VDDTATALRALNYARGLELELIEPLAGGAVSHATVVARPDGEELVLKWWPAGNGEQAHLQWIEHAAARVEALRQRGWPAPRTVLTATAAGRLFMLQERLHGKPPAPLEWAHVRQLLELSRLQDGPAPHREPWGAMIRSSLLHGADGYCLHDPLRAHSVAGSALLDRVIAAGVDVDPDALPAPGIAHFDFHHLNVLTQGDAVTGIVDCEGARAGDPAFDLVTLHFSSAEGGLPRADQDRLWAHLTSVRGPDVLRPYVAHMALRMSSWSAVHHEATITERWIERSNEVLDRI
jgi:aminoglycoside phosphotransferase (APT) family kinase protein